MSQIIVRGLGSGPAPANSFVEDVGVAAPVAGVLNILGGLGIATSGAGNTVTITATGSGVDWIVVSTPTATAVVNTGYIVTFAGVCTITLPATAAVGDTVQVVGTSSTSDIEVTLAGGMVLPNTAGVVFTGGVTFQAHVQSLKLLCVVANTRWVAIESWGSFEFHN